MLKSLLIVLLLSFVLITGCSEDDTVTPNNPVTSNLPATVSGDSVSVTSGFSSRSTSISSGTLNFSDRDSATISFYYSGDNNSITEPMTILYNDSLTFYSFTLSPTPAEQYMAVTIPSQRINAYFKYRISTSSSPGFSYFKFRNLNIDKK